MSSCNHKKANPIFSPKLLSKLWEMSTGVGWAPRVPCIKRYHCDGLSFDLRLTLGRPLSMKSKSHSPQCVSQCMGMKKAFIHWLVLSARVRPTCSIFEQAMDSTSAQPHVKLSLLRTIFFKGSLTRDFQLQVFFMNQFPPAPEYPNWTISNFFKNSWRYS
jgi:hypothetical protein